MGSYLSLCRRDNDEVVTNPQHGETAKKSSVFYDAREFATASMMAYPPATGPTKYARGSLKLDQPETLLHSDHEVRRRPTMVVKDSLEVPRVRVALRGYPGELTENELDAALKFRRAINEHPDSAYREMVYCFHKVEDEPYALCRFLRARNFDVDETMSMTEENIDKWKEAREHNFYPDKQRTVGCPESVFLTQFPLVQYGYAKNGCPVDYLMAGRMSLEGVECVTEVDRVNGAMWHSYIYDFPEEVASVQASNPNVVRVETLTIVDLNGLDTSQLNKQVLNILSGITSMMGCFPEVLNKLVVVNAPRVFSVFWKLIKSMLHPRTASKIEIYSNEREGNKRLADLVDKDQLLSDYGGDGPSFDSLMHTNTASTRHAVELMRTNGETRDLIELNAGEKATVCVYSRATGATVRLLKDTVELTKVKMTSDSNDSFQPNCTEVVANVKGPCKLQVSAQSNSKPEHYLVYVDVFPLEPR